MNKINAKDISNNFCPQTLFLYGTYTDDGKPDFGLFCWMSYCYLDGVMGVMAAIGGEKMTKDNIHARGVFSANLVTESMLPMADYLGCADGRSPDKMNAEINIGKGSVLEVPTLTDSPWTFELKVRQFIQLEESEVMICEVKNIQAADFLLDESVSYEERINKIAPARALPSHYFGWDGKQVGRWGGMAEQFKK